MKAELKEKFNDFFDVILSVLLDTITVLVIGGCIKVVQYVLENYIFMKKLENINNQAFHTIYNMSEIFLMVIYFIFIGWDLLSLILKFGRRLKNAS